MVRTAKQLNSRIHSINNYSIGGSAHGYHFSERNELMVRSLN